jgi:hypothetical protein
MTVELSMLENSDPPGATLKARPGPARTTLVEIPVDSAESWHK